MDFNEIQAIHEVAPELIPIPISSAIQLLYKILSAGTNVYSLNERKKLYNRNITLTIQGKDTNICIVTQTHKSNCSTCTVTLPTSALNRRSPTRKLLLFILSKVNHDIFSQGTLLKNTVSFELQELISIGLYQTMKGAKVGLRKAMNILSQIQLSGIESSYGSKGEKKSESIPMSCSLFKQYQVDNGYVRILLNVSEMNWKYLFQYYTQLPAFYFSLPPRPADLLFHVFCRARQCLDSLAHNGYFTIRLRAVQDYLQLPNEAKCPNPGHDILKPLNDAIDQINRLFKELYHDEQSMLELLVNNCKSARGILEHGYLKITLCGDLASALLSYQKEREKKIKAAMIRKEKIKEAVKVKMLVKASSVKGSDPYSL